jgi:hypothetical protein
MRRTHVPGILLLYHRPSCFRDASTVREHIGAFGRYSESRVRAVNTEYGFPEWLGRVEFSAIVFHYSVFGGNIYLVPPALLDYADGCRSTYKVAFFQDEHHFCLKRFAFINEHGIDCVFTLLEHEWVPEVYGRYTNVETVVPTLTGYVDERLLRAADRFARPDSKRRIDIGYRARELSAYMGRAAKEKTAIGEEFKRRAAGRDLVLDIETTEGARLYGDAWYRFLGDCRGCLGVEAGVSVFDLEGVVYERYEELRNELPSASFDQMAERLAPVMDPWEDRIYYRTISPRHFEAAAFRNCQILFKGRYSGILEAWAHYIPLEKDWSNLDEVLDAFRSVDARKKMTERCHQGLIQSGRYSYERFVETFDEVLSRAGVRQAALVGVRDRFLLHAVSKCSVRKLSWIAKLILGKALRRVVSTNFPGRAVLGRVGSSCLRPIVRWLARVSSTERPWS